jgi:formate--tetrahydrofolate ligase
MSVLLRDAILPNLVQTLEHTPTLVHGGPFANVAHGCSSTLATLMGLRLGDYLVTEAGFGSDLGAEKFFDLKCRFSKLEPAAAVIVATVKAVDFHGGFNKGGGWDNLSRHIDNVRRFGVEPIVAINRFPDDTTRALSRIKKACEKKKVRCEYSEVYAKGSRGGVRLAEAVVDAASRAKKGRFKLLYPNSMPLQKKIETIATQVYKARRVHFAPPAQRLLDQFQANGFGNLPICMAKTPMSFTDDPKIHGAPSNFDIGVNDVMLSAGAGFVVAIAGQVILMPGLPKEPAALRIKIDDEGNLLHLA